MMLFCEQVDELMGGTFKIRIDLIETHWIFWNAEERGRNFGFHCYGDARVGSVNIHENQPIDLAGIGYISDALHTIMVTEQKQVIPLFSRAIR